MNGSLRCPGLPPLSSCTGKELISPVLQTSAPPLHSPPQPRGGGVHFSGGWGGGVNVIIMVTCSESLELREVRLVQLFLGVCSSVQVPFPKTHSLAEALHHLYLQLGVEEQESKKNPGGTGVSGETGLRENDTAVVLTAESL